MEVRNAISTNAYFPPLTQYTQKQQLLFAISGNWYMQAACLIRMVKVDFAHTPTWPYTQESYRGGAGERSRNF